MTIKSFGIKRISIPLKKPFITAVRTVTSIEAVRVALHTNEETTGYGEAPAAALLTGETLPSIKEAISKYIASAIVNQQVDDDLSHLIKKSIYGNNAAKAAVEMAWLDLQAQKRNMPLYKMLNNLTPSGKTETSCKKTLTNDLTISVNTIEEMTAAALSAINDGFLSLKIKTGSNPDKDAQQLIELWSNIKSSQVSLRIDANQGWSSKQAIRIIRTWEDAGLPIDIIEQPVPAWDLEGLAEVQASTSHIIAADESVFSIHDALRCIKLRAAKVINLKLIKTGGLLPALEICNLCGEHGIECMVGCTMEGHFSSSAAAHLAASSSIITKVDIDCPLLRVSGGYVGGPEFNGPLIKMPCTPGIGVRPCGEGN